MVEPILSVRDLSIVYQARRGQVQAVRDISFDVERGEAVALIGESGSGTLTVQNGTPTATDDSFSVTHDSQLFIGMADLLANDSDPDGDALTVVIYLQPAYGTLEATPYGFNYIPDEGYVGPDSFDYYVTGKTKVSC